MKKKPTSPVSPVLPRWVWPSVLGVLAVAAAIWGGLSYRARAQVDAVLGDLREASTEVRQAIDGARADVLAHGDEAPSWGRLGQVAEANGFGSAARRAYVEAIERAPGDARWWYRRAVVEARLGDVSTALVSIGKAAELNGSYAPIFWRRGQWLLDQGDYTGAEQAFGRAASLASDDPAGVLGLARVHLARGDVQRAADAIEQLLAKHPGERYALQLLGTAYRRLGRLDEAEYALVAGATGEPNWNDPWSDEVGSLRQGYAAQLKDATSRILAGQFETAIPILERLRSQRPTDTSLLNQLGLSYLAAGRGDEGLQLLQQSVELDGENVETHLRLSSVLLEKGDVEKSLLHANRAVALSPQLSRAHEARGLALWRQGNRDSAVASMTGAIRYDPRNLQARVWLGYLLMERNDWANAAGQFEFAARRNPVMTQAFVGLGLARLNAGQLDAAESALARAATLDPRSRQVAEARAMLEQRRGGKAVPAPRS
ncbi:MAG: tetratricopeptide repeat protein [Vicinamibacterales bacterium]